MCQTCVDEGRLSQETYDKIEAFCEKWSSAEFGPAHIVLSDCNVDDYFVAFCLRITKGALLHRMGLEMPEGIFSKSDRESLERHNWYQDYDQLELEATKTVLQELLEIPEDVR